MFHGLARRGRGIGINNIRGCNLKLVDLQKLASKGYADGDGVGDYFDPETGEVTEWKSGDSLEWFMHAEISDTFDPDASDSDQIDRVIACIEQAQNDLQGAIESLREGLMLCKSKN